MHNIKLILCINCSQFFIIQILFNFWLIIIFSHQSNPLLIRSEILSYNFRLFIRALSGCEGGA